MRNMETVTTERLLQLEVRNSAHMVLAYRRVFQTCLGTHLRLLRFLSHSSLQRWEVEDGFWERLLACAQFVTKVPRTPSPAHMELTQRSWSHQQKWTRGFWDGSDQRIEHLRPMVIWSFSPSFISEKPLTKFKQDLSHLRKNKHDTRAGSCGACDRGCLCKGGVYTRYFGCSFYLIEFISIWFNLIFLFHSVLFHI